MNALIEKKGLEEAYRNQRKTQQEVEA